MEGPQALDLGAGGRARCLLPATHDPITDLDIFLKLMAMDDGAFGRRFDGSAAEFARLFPDRARVAINYRRAWRSDIAADELRRLAAAVASAHRPQNKRGSDPRITSFEELKLKKPTSRAVSLPDYFHIWPTILPKVETPWRWLEDIDDREREARIAEAFASLPYAERLKTCGGRKNATKRSYSRRSGPR